MRYSVLALASITCGLSVSCQQGPAEKTSAPASATTQNAPASPAPTDSAVAKRTTEYIDWDVVTINGKQHLLGRTEAIYQALGRPDSVVQTDDYCMPYFDKPFKVGYVRESSVEVYGDSAFVSSVGFNRNPKLELHTPTIRLSRNTTLADLAKVFPRAVKARSELDVYRKGKRVAVAVETAAVPNDYTVLLLFDGDKLESISLHTPC